MKPKFIIQTLLLLLVFSCSQESPQVKHKKNMSSSSPNLTNIRVVNQKDPICKMETENFITDTLHYQSKTYGFCSTYCKEEFRKNPEQYVEK